VSLAVAIESEDHVVLLTGADAVTFEDVLETRRHLMDDVELAPGYVTLIDVRNADLGALETSEIEYLAATRHLLPYVTVGSKVAVVVSSADAFDVARMYELSRPTAPEAMRVFYDYAEARRWLETRPWPGN
jgi:hypothetical protein